MEKKLQPSDIVALSSQYHIGVAIIKTILEVESSGEGFSENGKIKIQFEPHIFARYLTKKNIPFVINTMLNEKGKKEYVISSGEVSFANGVDTQKNEWVAYGEACKIDVECALLATSFGLGQIMGFNYSLAGYKSVKDMVKDFELSEYNQVKGMLTFIKNQPQMWKALVEKNWGKFKNLYNGVGDQGGNYALKLAETYNKHARYYA